MNRKEFQHLSKSELIGIIAELMKEDGAKELTDLKISDIEAVQSDLNASANRRKTAVREHGAGSP